MVLCLFRSKLEYRARENFGGWRIFQVYSILRFLEFVAGLTILGLYMPEVLAGTDTQRTGLSNVVVGALSALIALITSFPIKPKSIFLADLFETLIFAITFGVDCRGRINQPDPGIAANDVDSRMHHALYVVAAAGIMWTMSAIYSTVKFASRKGMLAPDMAFNEMPQEHEVPFSSDELFTNLAK